MVLWKKKQLIRGKEETMGRLNPDDIIIRKMSFSDLDAIVAIDERVSHKRRREYYEMKMEHALDKADIVTSLVAEVRGKVVGFIMGNLYVGDFGIPENTATIETIGVDPELQKQGIARGLAEQFISNMKAAGVDTVHTLVEWNEGKLLMFFNSLGFHPAKTLSLEIKL